jgi:uncharacterized protein YegL
MRRLPVYFLIDVSESMVGEPIQQVEEGLAMVVKTLKTDPYALETVYISVIAFAGMPKELIPLTDIIAFYPPKLPIGGGTSLGKALDFLMNEFDKNLVRTTHDQKGDWKPIVFLFTDGIPTDNVDRSVNRWNSSYKTKANIVAVSFGTSQNMALLQRLTENVLIFENTDTNSYKHFFRWITASIQVSSASLQAEGSNNMQLAKIDKSTINLSKDNSSKKLDDTVAVFAGRCQVKSRPYLIKYRKAPILRPYLGSEMELMGFKLVGAYPVDESYFELSDSKYEPSKIEATELMGNPTCPVCGNQYGFSVCACGKIFCIGKVGFNKCPWCNQLGDFGFGEGKLDVGRTQG